MYQCPSVIVDQGHKNKNKIYLQLNELDANDKDLFEQFHLRVS